MKKKTSETSVIKSNLLIESRYKLSLGELKLLLWMIKQININDKDFKEYEIYIKDFIEAQKDVNNTNFYKIAKKMTKGFLSKVLEIQEPDGLLQINFMSHVKYYDGEGYITYTFDPKLKPHLIRLKSQFSSYHISNVINMKSVYSIRIYQLLKAFEGLNKRTITIDELRYILVIEDKYKLYGSIKQYILEVAKRDCKKHSDIYFDYTANKKGRKVHSITFYIKKQKQRRLFDGKDYIKTDEVLILQKQTEKTLQTLAEDGKDAVPMPDELKKMFEDDL
jgi:plasmid replication initiation protein